MHLSLHKTKIVRECLIVLRITSCREFFGLQFSDYFFLKSKVTNGFTLLHIRIVPHSMCVCSATTKWPTLIPAAVDGFGESVSLLGPTTHSNASADAHGIAQRGFWNLGSHFEFRERSECVFEKQWRKLNETVAFVLAGPILWFLSDPSHVTRVPWNTGLDDETFLDNEVLAILSTLFSILWSFLCRSNGINLNNVLVLKQRVYSHFL